MLSFEEIAVLLSLNSELGVLKTNVANYASELYKSERFDKRVALATIDRLLGLDYISKDRSGFLYLTVNGEKALQTTKSLSQKLMYKLSYG